MSKAFLKEYETMNSFSQKTNKTKLKINERVQFLFYLTKTGHLSDQLLCLFNTVLIKKKSHTRNMNSANNFEEILGTKVK